MLATLRTTPWLLVMAATFVVDSVVATVSLGGWPHTFTAAYGFAGDLAPFRVWAVVWGLIAAGLVVGLAQGRSRWWLLAPLSVYVVACAVFGLSIARLVLAGSPGALIGAMKWWITAGAALLLMRSLPSVRIVAAASRSPLPR